MTWVIGTPTLFGYSVGMADIQATIEYNNGTKKYIDSVQKIYPLGKFIAGGFSGSIEVGFFMLEDLRKNLLEMPEGNAWIPNYIIPKWAKRAKYLYKNIDREYKEIQFLFIAVHPSKDNGIPGQPLPYGCILKSPNFNVEEIKMNMVASIGSGNNIQEYKKSIDAFKKDIYNPLMQMETASFGGYGNALASTLTIDVYNNPRLGVSKHFHVCTVKRGEISLMNNDCTHFPNNGEVEKIRMPRVATSWKEFQDMMKDSKVSLKNAQALC